MSDYIQPLEKQKILDDVHHWLNEGYTQKQAFEHISSTTRYSYSRIKKMWQRRKIDKDGRLEYHGHTRLTRRQEEGLLGLALGRAAMSQPLSIERFLAIVNNIHSQGKKLEPFTRKWLTGFLDRHRALLNLDKSRLLAPNRSNEGNLGHVLSLIDFHTDFLLTHHFPPWARLNVDESRVTVADARGAGQRLVKRGYRQHGTRAKRESSYMSVVPFVSAAGETIVVFYVLPLPSETGTIHVPHEIGRSLRGSYECFYMFTETGYTNRETFRIMIKKFEEIFNRRYPGLEHILYMDRLSNHVDEHVLETLSSNGGHGVCFPVGTTHFIQPLDDVVFALFKSLLKSERDELLDALETGPSRGASPILVALVPAIRGALTPAAIQRSFRDTYIYPWFPERLGARAREAYPDPNFDHPELGTTGNEIYQAVLSTTPKPKNAAVTPFKAHKALSSGLFHLDDIVAEEKRYEAEKAEKEAEKKQKKEERQQAIALRQEEREAQKKRKENEHAERQELKRQAQAKKAKSAAETTCSFCRSRWQGGQGWLWCDNCPTYLICPKCQKDPHQFSIFDTHDKECASAILPPADPPIPIPIPVPLPVDQA